MRTIDPFAAFDLVAPATRAWDTNRQLSEKQRQLLLRNGIDPDRLSYPEGTKILQELFRRWNAKLCTLRQANCLKGFGYDTRNMSMKQASALITALKANRWKRPG